jgi:hypothetical protein
MPMVGGNERPDGEAVFYEMRRIESEVEFEGKRGFLCQKRGRRLVANVELGRWGSTCRNRTRTRSPFPLHPCQKLRLVELRKLPKVSRKLSLLV